MNLRNFLEKNHLPTNLIIRSIQERNGLKTVLGTNCDEKSNIFTGKTESGDEVIAKEINLNDRAEEIKILWILTRKRIDDNSRCKSCNEKVCKNFTKLIGCFEENKKIYIVLEKANYNFLEFISKPRDKKVVIEIFFDIAKAVKCLHANFIAHLDISASNVLIVEENNKIFVRLVDFGESEIFEGTNISINPLTSRKSFRDTKIYTAPEREGFRYNEQQNYYYDPCTADIFSLGIFFIIFCLNIKIYEGNKFEITKLLDQAQNKGKISFMEKELALFMTEKEPVTRIDIKGICTNPVSWTDIEYFDFLKKVINYKKNHKSIPVTFEKIEKEFTDIFFNGNKEMIPKDVKQRRKTFVKKDPASIFSLVERIYDSGNVSEMKIYKTLIDLLYFYMKNDMKSKHPELYGISTVDRCFKERKLTLDLLK